MKVEEHFNRLEALLITSPAVKSFQVIRKEITPADGKIRVKVQLVKGELLEFFEYVVEEEDEVLVRKYSYHWQSADGKLIKRWDNVYHYPTLPNAPHHLHRSNGVVVPVDEVPSLGSVLREIERRIGR